MEMNYASKGVGTAGLTTGIIGTALGALGALGGNGLSGILGGVGGGQMTAADVAQAASSIVQATNGRCSDNMPVTRYDMQQMEKLMAKDNEIALLKSEQNTEVKIADVYERIMTRVNADQRAQADWNAAQMVNNANMSAAIATNSASIAALQNCCGQITKLIVPADSVCPKPMPQYNSWTAPTNPTT